MAAFVVLAKIRVRPGTREAFKSAVLENARLSVQDEPACISFDIMECPDDENLFYAHEAFDDEAGFDAHRVTPHSMAFKVLANNMMIEHDSFIGRKIN